MFKATCDSCGGTAEVPFRPTGEKPVYCSACFKRDGGGKFGGNDRRDSGRRDFGGDRPSFGGGEKRMFKTICAKCNAETEVPFRPSGDKPAFCRDCFSKVGGRGAGTGAKPTGSAGPSGDVLRSELAALHEKLDLILDALYYDEDEEEDGTVTLEAKPAVKNAPETAVDGKKDGKKDEKKADKKSEKMDGKKSRTKLKP
jgi:CxxC-x17-CxxC domain-containing protein